MPNVRSHSSKSSRNRKIWWLVGLVVVVLAVLAILQLTHKTHFFQSKPTTVYQPIVPTGGQDTKGETGAQSLGNAAGNSSSDSSANSQKSGGNTSNSSADLIDPTGNFVNTHHPSLTGSANANKMFSVCNTTPGASCHITFIDTATGTTKTLTAQTVNSGGAVYWSWTLQQLGLSQGTWKTVATASLGGQSKSTTDAMNLEVSP